MPLTDVQTAILELIADRIESEGMPPSQTEIARAFGFKSVRAAQYHLEALEAAGAIERLPGKARGLRVLQAPAKAQSALALKPMAEDDAVRLPVLGRVAAGQPLGADIGSDTTVVLDRHVFHPTPDYLLRVQGDSMRDEAILDGDLIGVRRTADARHGQVVIARVDGEITVKVLHFGGDGLRLMPRNPEHAPIEVADDQDFAIEGLFCGLLRPSR
ncbi:MAG: transcriptional repressor LexA [Silanimonas sp.]